MTTHGRISTGVARRSVQKTASMRSFPSGSATSTEQMSTGGKPGVYPKAVCEKTHKVFRWPPYQFTSTVSEGVSLRFAQACRLRWRGPLVGLRPRLPGGWGSGG